MMNDTPEARIVESFGRRAIVETASGERRAAVLFGKKLQVVCGDRILYRVEAGSDEWHITDVLPRRSLFARTDSRGRMEPLAANLSLLIAIVAPQPLCDLYIIDRYLAGAAYAGIRSAVLVNKADIAAPDLHDELTDDYRKAGYPVLQVSAHTGAGIDELRALLGDETALLAGQSGVGKSTLTNLLVPESTRATRDISASTGEGRHTTVSAALFHLPDGGILIDSPGVRDYAPAPVAEAQVQVGWPEILRLAPACRFNDCLHLREPGCQVIGAVESGVISARRYEGYKRLINLMRQLVPSHERPK